MTDTSTIHKRTNLLNLLRDAAVQRRLMLPRTDDQAFMKSGGRILYAVDMDVVYMYANPREANRSQPGRIAYGQVFQEDDPETAEALTIRLADWIFHRLSAAPLMIIPPIEEELEHFLTHKIETLGNSPRSPDLQVEDLNALLRTAGALDDAADENVELIQDTLNKAQLLVYLERGPAGEYRRVEQLMSLGRLAGPDGPALVEALDDRVFADVLKPFERVTDVWRHSVARDEWLDRLLNSGNPERRPQLERDASALARLELWNKALEGKKRKIVYITGSRTLFEAAWKVQPEPYDAASVGPSFGDLYLRHPRAYVAEPGVLDTGSQALKTPPVPADRATPPNEQAQFTKMLRIFLASFKTRSEVLDNARPFDLSPHGREVARETLHHQPNLGREMRTTWEGYTAALKPTYRPPGSVEEHLIKAFSNTLPERTAIGRWERVRARLDGLIEAELHATWESCFKVATRTGFALDFHNVAGGGQASRSVPPLSFDSWERTHRFIDTVSRWHSGADFDVKAYEQGVAAIQRENATGYAYYLAHAALFGGRGKWGIAALLADRALGLTPGGAVDSQGHANGREASYLLAVCRRHAVQNVADLAGLEDIVQRAKDILAAEIKSRGYFEAIPERFDGELLALKLTRLMYERYCDATKKGDWDERVSDLLAELAGQHELIRDRLVAATTALKAQSMPRNGPQRLVRTLQKLDLRVSTNLASLLMVDGNPESLRADGRFRVATNQLMAYEREAESDSPEISYFVRAIGYCAAAILSEPGRRKAAQKRAKTFLSDYEIKRHMVFPYDLARLQQFRDTLLN